MLDPAALTHEADLAARLILAAILGAVIGLERELHAHPAGIAAIPDVELVEASAG